jgi:protein SCO1
MNPNVRSAVRLCAVVSLLVAAAATAAPPEQNPAEHYFGGIQLLDQDGKKVLLYEDLMRNNTVAINSMFTSCHGSCPVMAGNFAAIQARYGDRLGKDLRLISISVDPDETPAKMKAFAQQFNAKPGWVFLTGKREDVERALRKLGQFVEDKTDHSNVVLIGNDRTGLWKKAFGMAKPQDLITVVESVLDDHQ